MKSIKHNFLLLVIVLLTGLFTQAGATVTLHVNDIDKAYNVLDAYHLLEEFTNKYPEKNILFYVHGRKKDIEDEKARMAKLEKYYNVKVLMFHWNSYDKFLNRPTKNAEEASLELFEAFQLIRDFKRNHPEFFAERSINLLCHSMGNLVLKYTIEKYFDEFEQDEIFTNYVGNAPDVPLKDHRTWLSQFKMAQNNYIMMNNQDFVLTFSYLLDVFNKDLFHYRLGLGFENYLGRRDQEKTKLVPFVNYVDLSKVLKKDHGYFAYSDRAITEVFNQILNGNPIEDAFLDVNSKIRLVKDKGLSNSFKIENKVFRKISSTSSQENSQSSLD
ncbi:MAG: alpha/beta hydrolase [Bacteriovoracaceae bacterium]|nr:alpha/beta hydrolase [Bacteriovoracaceae bacterium]